MISAENMVFELAKATADAIEGLHKRLKTLTWIVTVQSILLGFVSGTVFVQAYVLYRITS